MAFFYFFIPHPISLSNVDLHSHSSASDGLLSPGEVARRAADNGVTLFALTDHDTLGGLLEAQRVATECGIRFVNGVEISVEWETLPIHILGLNFDRDDPCLKAGILSISSGRTGRAARMSAELAKIGIKGALEGALRYAKNPALISRAHFARYLVEIGICKDIRRVFESYLVPGRPGYVEHQWASLAEAVGWIVGAGGVAAIAHPARYKLANKKLRQLLVEFKSLGGSAIEVVSSSHSVDAVNTFAKLAKTHNFMASCGSDFHGPDESAIDLGHIPPLPVGLKPIWEVF